MRKSTQGINNKGREWIITPLDGREGSLHEKILKYYKTNIIEACSQLKRYSVSKLAEKLGVTRNWLTSTIRKLELEEDLRKTCATTQKGKQDITA